MHDKEVHVRGDAALALANTRDSRALFSLVNFYNAGQYQEKVRVLQALAELRDPRSVTFLDNLLGEEQDLALRSQAQRARDEIVSGTNDIFIYTYSGPDENVERARTIEGQIPITSSRDLDSATSIIEEYSKAFSTPRPQTYVVTQEGDFVIGGLIQEHVEVAKGRDVLSAGEVEFEKIESGWNVRYINNRSNGYYPDQSSFTYVKASLKKAGINVSQGYFTEVFPRDGFNDSDFLKVHPQFE